MQPQWVYCLLNSAQLSSAPESVVSLVSNCTADRALLGGPTVHAVRCVDVTYAGGVHPLLA